MEHDRKRLLEELRERLRGRGWHRIEMTLIVMFTGMAGFFLSGLLLLVGIESMPLRYALAMLGGYAAFLGLVRVWVELHRRGVTIDTFDGLDLADPGIRTATDALGGGEFGGGGASGEWAGETPAVAASSSKGGGIDLDLDEGWLIVVPILMIVGGLIAGVLVIWSAPALLAEVLLDVVLVSSLYRGLKQVDRRAWFVTAMRKTWIPAAIVLLVLVVGGIVIQSVMPDAETIGDVFRNA